MSSKTKIVVFHMKELIYTGIFLLFGILLIILLLVLFAPDKKTSGQIPLTDPSQESSYIPGVYTSSLVLNDHALEVWLTVTDQSISSVKLVNLDESITTMYPLIRPAFDSLAKQLCETQSLSDVTYSNESRYTTLVLMEAIQTALDKATVTFDIAD